MEELDQQLAQKIAALKGNTSLPRPPYPELPTFAAKTTVKQKLKAYQEFISAFEYNFTGQQYFIIRKDRGLKRICNTAKEIMKEALPIQCLEAVFLGCYLTAGMKEVQRIPVSFKSQVDGHTFRHIVLALHYNEKWGALGLSRKDTLMYKELKFKTFSDLMLSYKKAYESVWHNLTKVYVGFPFSHDVHSMAPIKWRMLKVRLVDRDWDDCSEQFERFVKDAEALFSFYNRCGSMPEDFEKKYNLVESDQEEEEEDKDGEVTGKDQKPTKSTKVPSRIKANKTKRSSTRKKGKSKASRRDSGSTSDSAADSQSEGSSSTELAAHPVVRGDQDRTVQNEAEPEDAGDDTSGGESEEEGGSDSKGKQRAFLAV